ncbi:MAG: 23S rRNA (adenine(2503)-C(2))-methyltransferase RlmN [Planctomycetaceae bacterium]|nr:23S rRNA (adenine(2503)-C(2))-methyltransferase RlmN [Planctomycetaceae bacterium]
MHHLLEPASWNDLKSWLAERGQPAFRAAQIRKWVFERRAESFEAMSDLPKVLRGELAAEFTLWTTTLARHLKSSDGTEKLLLELGGPPRNATEGVPYSAGRIECVLLRDGERRSICISTQVGCAMGCVFCASGLDGVERNLATGEIVEQMLRLQRLLPGDERLSHIVVMGMGEPLANLDHLLPALEEAGADDGLAISHRRITISTVGLPKPLLRLCEENARYNLAVSLHAPTDELRTRIVPTNKSTGLADILAAADRYFDVSGRRLTFEYVLLAGLNDQPQHAHQLVDLLAGRTALLNVIPYNPVVGLPYATPSGNAVNRFREILIAGGINVKFRQRKGDDINAACGQLRRSAPGRTDLQSVQ